MPIQTIGIELEGNWPMATALNRNGDPRPGFAHDGSVHRCTNEPDVYVGEYDSPPFKNTKELFAYLEENELWPKWFDYSCGMHFHTAMDTGTYAKFMDKSFYEAFMEMIAGVPDIITGADKDQLIRRVEGECSYCEHGWHSDRQSIARTKDGPRYKILNFCYSLHKTMEIRVLPQMLIGNAKKVLPIIEDWMHRQAEKPSRTINIPVNVDIPQETIKRYKV